MTSQILTSLKGKTLFITGSSRGIGRAIALRAAADGANVTIVAKTVDPHPKLPGTIFSVAEEVEKLGGQALPIACDLRYEDQVQSAFERTIEKFGGIDIVVNNASAISLTPTEQTDMKKYDLMHQINARGTFLVSKRSIPYLKRSKNPHILMLSPPLSVRHPEWFSSNLAYSMSKFNMSMCVLGLAEELKPLGIAVNALWPKTIISTAALQAIDPENTELNKHGRTPEIVADAAYIIFLQPSRQYTGNFTIDEDILRSQGVTDFTKYQVTPGGDLAPDFFLEPNYTFRSPQNLNGEKSNEIRKYSVSIPGFVSSDIFQSIQGLFCKQETMEAMSGNPSIKGLYGFEIRNQHGKVQTWTLDFSSLPGEVSLGLVTHRHPSVPDVMLYAFDEDFVAIYKGKISGQQAFLAGKLRIKGNIVLAMSLEQFLRKIRPIILAKL